MFAVFFLGKELNMLKIYHSKVILIILYHGLFPRLYEGRVVQGPLRGTQAVFKVCIELSLC